MNLNIDNSFVRNLRNYLKITQEDFAKELNINISTIRAVEQNQRNVPKSMQQAIQNKYKQFMNDNKIGELNNITDKTIYLSNDVKAIINICNYYGISQTELSKRTGVSRQTLNEILNFKNNKKLSLQVKRAIENIYGQLIHYYDEFQIQAAERFIYARTEIIAKSQKDLAKELNIPLPKLIDIENNTKGITENIVKYLESEYLINPLWLLEGKGNPTKIDDMEMEDKKFDNWQFKRLREFLGYNQSEFAEKVGSAQQIINMIEKNKRGVPASIREGFYKTFKISYEEAIACESAEALNIALNKQTINSAKIYNLNTNNIVPIPFYNVGAAAGNGIYLLDEIPEEDVLYFDERWLKNILGANPDNLHLIFADGDSMDSGFDTKEDIKDKDLLLVDTSQLTGNNKIFVILVNNTELRVKRLFKKMDGSLIISSNNPKYPDEIYNSDSPDIDIKVIGKVVWNGSKENV